MSAILVMVAGVAGAAGVVGTGSPASCTEAALNAALSGGGLVTFNCGTGGHTITVTSEKAIAADTEIDGGGLVAISGGNATRILSAGAGVSLTLRRLTLSGAYLATTPSQGGAVFCAGCDLAVYDTTFESNHVEAFQTEGGAIWFGPPPAGGDSGSLVVVRSAFIGNSATSAWSYGGAIYLNNTATTAYVVDSTFYGNVAGGDYLGQGGAIRLAGDVGVAIVNCTFSHNDAPNGAEGGALYALFGGTFTLVNTVIAGSVSSSNCGGLGTFADGGNNLQFGGTTADSCGATIPTPGSDPLGGSVPADNGGATPTIALPAGSAAINAGDPATCAAAVPSGPGGDDQRGFAHVGVCDIGAFEYGAFDPDARLQAVPAFGSAGLTVLAGSLLLIGALAARRFTT